MWIYIFTFGLFTQSAVSQDKDLRFIFIKATEGMDYQDKSFSRNWLEARKYGLLCGAYHYFKTSSSGLAQAQNFINHVPAEKNSLPPVVDVEEEGWNEIQFKKELNDFLQELEAHYGKKPIIYVTYPLYDRYIENDFAVYPIWIRDVAWRPRLSDRRAWDFWQYSNRGKVQGIDTFVDFNVYAGDYEGLKKLAAHY